MKTSIKLGIAGAIIGIGLLWKNKKKGTNEEIFPELAQPNFEGKMVVSENGNWFIILNGKRWFTGSVQAIMDFQAQYPGNAEPIRNVSESALANYPVAGTINENLNLVPFQISNDIQPMERLKRLGAQICTRKDRSGSTTIYSGQGGDRPCPYGGVASNTVPKPKVNTMTGV